MWLKMPKTALTNCTRIVLHHKSKPSVHEPHSPNFAKKFHTTLTVFPKIWLKSSENVARPDVLT